MTTRLPDKVSLEIKRVSQAPRARVYTAWTDPDRLREWFGPENVQTRNRVAETRVGGKFRRGVISAEGEKMTLRGEYREVQPDRKIVFTWQWEDREDWEQRDSVVTVELSDCDGGTEVRLAHEQLPSEESRDRHAEGWKSVLDKLEKFCRK